MHLWVVLGHISFHERIISDGEGHPVQALQLQLVEGVRPEHNRVGYFGILLLDRLLAIHLMDPPDLPRVHLPDHRL